MNYTSEMIHGETLYHNHKTKMFYVSKMLARKLEVISGNPISVEYVKGLVIITPFPDGTRYFLNRKGHEKRFNFRAAELSDKFPDRDRQYFRLVEKRGLNYILEEI